MNILNQHCTQLFIHSAMEDEMNHEMNISLNQHCTQHLVHSAMETMR